MSHATRSYDNDSVTAALSPPFSAAHHLRARLEEPRFRAWISAIVRRRVPAADADDVLQAIMCDALASAGIPIDEEEIGKWISGIARHKVADYHRRSKREVPTEDEPAPADPRGEMHVLLRGVVEDATSTPRGKEAFEWIIREHAGEELARIAKEEKLPAPVVRQRVSRLRRALRMRWLGAGALLSLCLTTIAISEWRRTAPEHIVADAAGSATAARVLTSIDGEWKITDSSGISPDFASSARIAVHGARLVVEIGGISHERAISIDAVHDRSFDARILDGADAHRITVTLGGDALFVTDGARSVRLVRP